MGIARVRPPSRALNRSLTGHITREKGRVAW
nr:MAG TPA: hypothetical protein [Caudoviricetes sp.]